MPVPALALALGAQALSSGIGFVGAKKADKKAKEQAQHDAELHKGAVEAQVEGLIAGKEEQEKATALKMSRISRQAAIERARIITAAGEAGVAGASVSRQLLETFQHEAEGRGVELYNLKATKDQYNRDINAVQAGLQINLPRAEKLAPSPLSAVASSAMSMLQIGISTGHIK
jgi:hypothetical protein